MNSVRVCCLAVSISKAMVVALALLTVSAGLAETNLPARLLVSDHEPNRLVIINTRDGSIEWEYPCKHPQDAHWLADGTILAAVGQEAQIIRPDLAGKKGGEVLWSVKPGGEVPVAQPLPDGGIMVACSPGPKGLLIEFDKNRKEVQRIEVTTRVIGHSQFRFCRKTPEGTYLIPAIGDGILYELDRDGKEIWNLQMSSACAAERLSDGSTLVCGKGTVRLYDKERREIRVLDEKQLMVKRGIFAGLHRLPGGGWIIANWRKKGPTVEESFAVAISAEGQVLWRLNHPLVGRAAHVQAIPDAQMLAQEYPLPGYMDRTKVAAMAVAVPGSDQLPVTVEMRVRLFSSKIGTSGIDGLRGWERVEYPLLTRGHPTRPGDAFVLGVYDGRLFLRGSWLSGGTVSSDGKRDLSVAPAVTSDVQVAMGVWHDVACVVSTGRVDVYVDNQPVKWNLPFRAAPERAFSGSWGFGCFVNSRGQVSGDCDAWFGPIRMSRGAVSPSGGQAEVDTLALWRFDKHCAGVVTNSAAGDAPLELVDAPLSPTSFRKRYPERPNPFDADEDARDLARIRDGLVTGKAHLKLIALADEDLAMRDAVLADWRAQSRPEGYFLWAQGVPGYWNWPEEQLYDQQAAIDYTNDYDMVSVAVRRLRALSELLKRQGVATARVVEGDLQVLEQAEATLRTQKVHASAWMDWPAREPLYYLTCALRRKLAFANPKTDFKEILFLARATYAGSRVAKWQNGDLEGGHFSTQYYAPSTRPGGGIFVVENWKQDPKVRNVLKDSVVKNGRLAGLKLDGDAFLSPSLSYDGRYILFAHSSCKTNRYTWTPDTTWNIFRVNADGSELTMLTDSAFNDFDPVQLPSGRIAFVSERRGSYIRCFSPVVPSFALHSMKADGTDIYPLSYYELNEWNPSVNNDGKLVYSRWDYTDRGFDYGATFWICGPDGSDPRSPHGNYPYPWTSLPQPELERYRQGSGFATLAQMGIRAIPDSNLYVLTGGGHHGEHFGSLLVLDLRKDDVGGFSQLRRLTPYSPSAEIESPPRHQWQYGTPWPLSEDLFLCNSWEDLYLLDRFGNQELVCERAKLPADFPVDTRLTHPIPFRPRKTPPILPDRTNVGADRREGLPGARVMIANVYKSDIPLPKGVRIKYVRIVQNFCKTYFQWGVPMIGLALPYSTNPKVFRSDEHTPRAPLGIVPVEEDGSAYFYAPPGKMLMFQLLDEEFRAVHSMRSATYLHGGELLTCTGCHAQEDTQKAPAMDTSSLTAMRRKPSVPQPELGHIEPVSYFRQIRPIVQRSCLPCHAKEKKGPQAMDYPDLGDLFFQTSQVSRKSGSRTIPGYYGARACMLGQATYQHWKAKKISEADYRQVSLWLDCNSLRLTAHCEEKRQLAGELVWPQLDIDPNDPLGLEGMPGEMTPERTFADAARLHPAQAHTVFPKTAYDRTCAPTNYVPRRGPAALK